MIIIRLGTLRVQIYKTLNELNTNFNEKYFTVKETDTLTWEQYKLNINTSLYNQIVSGYKSLHIFGQKIWNKLPYDIKSGLRKLRAHSRACA